MGLSAFGDENSTRVIPLSLSIDLYAQMGFSFIIFKKISIKITEDV